MADEQVDILIRTTADQAGTQQTVQGLNQVKAAGTEAGEKVTGHFRGLHKVFHALNEVVPGLEEQAEMTEILIRRRAAELAEIRQPELTKAAEAAELKKTKALEDLGSFDKSGIDDRYKEAQKALKGFEAKHNEEFLLTTEAELEAERKFVEAVTEAVKKARKGEHGAPS